MASRSPIKWMGNGDLRLCEFQRLSTEEIPISEERRCDRKRVGSRTHIVQQARLGQLGRTSSAANRLASLNDRYINTSLGQHDCGRKAIWS